MTVFLTPPARHDASDARDVRSRSTALQTGSGSGSGSGAGTGTGAGTPRRPR
ncbi:hypothetical protein [Streptomyces qinglanensis]|uniref:hypothetical protein n=1 Tax=Streptomyces qinglanensis TaxID=943816 RepID=UPI0013A6947E|nr:hypothetical protein [Streptomyces qinglanensis]